MKRPIIWLALLPALAQAAGTAAWEMNSYQDFLRGRFTGVSLTRDGRLTLAPKADTVYSGDQPVIWSIAQGPDGAIYAGTGHRGQVVRIDKSGKSSIVWTAEQPEVFAVAFDGKGVLYAATSPNGRVYKIEDGKAREYFDPGATYIWSLKFTGDGTLYVGTGDRGKIFRIDSGGKGEVYYETGQTHVICLALDREGRLLAGTDPNGVLYRINAKDRAFVLYDANLPEIHALAVTPEGSVYAAAQGGSSLRRGLGAPAVAPGAPGAPPPAAAATTITVAEEPAQGGMDIKPKPEGAKPSAATPQVTAAFSPVVDLTGIEKSAVYRISPDHTVETLWSSKDENAYGILPFGRELMIATDGQGRVYRLTEDRKATLLVQTNESEATQLVETEGGLLAATANLGRIFRLGKGPGTNGVYESPVHDAGTVARWGRLSWRADAAGGSARLEFRTRSGNLSRPDLTWSDWSGPIRDNGGAVASPNARYIQWKVELAGSDGNAPVLDSVTVAYLPQNTPPSVKSVQVAAQTAPATTGAKTSAPTAATAAYSITVTDTGEAAPATSTGTPTQTLPRSSTRQVQIAWQAEDTDGDRLSYTLHFRGEDEQEWKLIKDNVAESSYTLDGDVLADGRYFFRVIASDLPSNPPASARKAELSSAPVLIDNTPPSVAPGRPQRTGPRMEIEFEASDAAGALRRAEFSVDAGPWTPLEAADGIIDSREEKFRLRLDSVPAGEHLVVLRVYDSADNAGLAKVIVRP
jgi:hypothetical protein